jgi:hypothetical protein
MVNSRKVYKMGILASLLAAAALFLAPPSGKPVDTTKWSHDGKPQMVLSNFRLINCLEGSGSGWMIGKDILVTAKHVASGSNCTDAATGNRLTTYKNDPKQDISLMTGILPDYGTYIKYSCDGFRPGQEYEVYGWSRLGFDQPVFRMHRVWATDKFTKAGDFYDEGDDTPSMRIFDGYTVPGMSGTAYTRDDVAYGIVTAGYGMNTYLGYLVYPEVYATDLKDTILCPKGQTQ